MRMPPRITTGAAGPRRPRAGFSRTAGAAGRLPVRPCRAGAPSTRPARSAPGRPARPGIMPAANNAGTDAPGHQHRIHDEGHRGRNQDVGGRRCAHHAGRKGWPGSRRAFMAAIITPPTAAALAGPEPEMPPMNMATAMATSGSMPGPRPTMAVAKLTSRAPRPSGRRSSPPARTSGSPAAGTCPGRRRSFAAPPAGRTRASALASAIAAAPARPSARRWARPAAW
jgi:hypothetical protein